MPKVPELAARTSAFNSSVTLYEPVPSLRRSTRFKTPRQSPYATSVPDIEDLVADVPDNDETVKEEFEGDVRGTSSSQKTRPRKRATQKAAGAKPKAAAPKKPLKVAHDPPQNWEEVYATMKAMRSRFIAPVDTMGCEVAGPKLGDPDPRNTRFATLVSLILSTQTKDEITDAALAKLKVALGGRVSIENVINASNETIANAINKVGFWQLKAKSLQTTARMLRDQFDSDVPKTIEELTTLAGVGPKVGFLALHSCWNINSGIGVDTHVHRITNRLGWHNTKDNESTRIHLESWLPHNKWGDINHMMVGFGQVICTPKSPRCDVCDVGKKGLCPSREEVKNVDKRKAIPWVKPEIEEAKIQVGVEESMTSADSKLDMSSLIKMEVEDEGGGAIVVKSEDNHHLIY